MNAFVDIITFLILEPNVVGNVRKCSVDPGYVVLWVTCLKKWSTVQTDNLIIITVTMVSTIHASYIRFSPKWTDCVKQFRIHIMMIMSRLTL